DAVAMSNVLVNTNLAAAGGVVMALLVSRPLLGRIDLFAGLNGAIAGLVAITAGPDLVDHYWSILIGAVGGLIVVAGIKFLEDRKVDDVVGAIPAHLMSGAWGTLVVGISGAAPIGAQLVGILAIGAFVFVVSWVVWQLLDRWMGLRVEPDIERLGQDAGELGIESYPEFLLVPEEFGDED
ncbi:MAG: ammonium transporter, partial [bacterium]|nr:ammonium transporter [bacterium]